MTNTDLGSWMRANQAKLRDFSEFPTVEINAILSHTLQKPVSWIYAHPETILDSQILLQLNDCVQRLQNREPLAYILHKQAFFGLDFYVDSSVLIPRPETELLVELAISWLEEHPERKNVLDIGTGSGIIAITLADRFPNLSVTAVDTSPEALQIARLNAATYHLEEKINFLQSDLFSNIQGTYDLVVANLPYIPSADLELLNELRFEPALALDGGSDGLNQIRRLVQTCADSLALPACLFLEIQYNQGNKVKEIFAKFFPQAEVTIYKDLADLPRVVKILI
ncbi:MAG: peptide chain release factor N(5)-glutamine methyltransferase [Anaerolineaceae bacterium]|nr:peptide chain release factor N(5)-glutamine methyltransferase [Anaerolineaceae bacterium]